MNYPGAIQDPAPAWKQGYAAYPSPQPTKEGVVIHSMVGSFTAARSRLMGSDQASWCFSITKAGVVYQHYNALAVTWHCGVTGDALPLSAAVGNVALIGIEMEGGPIGNVSEPWTTAQYDSVLKLLVWIWQNVPGIKWPTLRSSLWEHAWLSATSCPSNRDPWARLVPDLISRLTGVTTMFLIRNDSGGIYVVGPEGKRWIDDTTELSIYQEKLGTWKQVSDAAAASIPDVAPAHMVSDVWHMLFDGEFNPGAGIDNRRLIYMMKLLQSNHAILFDDGSADGPTDKRRLIYMGNNIKKMTTSGPLTPENLAAIAKAVADEIAKRAVA